MQNPCRTLAEFCRTLAELSEYEYDLGSAIWESEYVTMDAALAIPALGQKEDAVPLDVDRDDLFAKLSQGM